MMRSLLLTLALLATLALPADGAGAAAGAPWAFPVDGWYTWQVAAVDGAPNWCCVDWNRGRSTPITCDLDGSHFNFSDDSSRFPDVGEVQVYALINDGKAARVRAMSPACPVESRGPITDFGRVEPAASLGWLKHHVRDDDSNALAAIAVHSGPEALAFLTGLALHGQDSELREEAVFWLAQTGAPESEAVIFAALRNESSAGARENAVFALSQLPDERAVASLVKIVHDVRMEREVREQALFWLVQSDSDEAYDSIDALLSKRVN